MPGTPSKTSAEKSSKVLTERTVGGHGSSCRLMPGDSSFNTSNQSRLLGYYTSFIHNSSLFRSLSICNLLYPSDTSSSSSLLETLSALLDGYSKIMRQIVPSSVEVLLEALLCKDGFRLPVQKLAILQRVDISIRCNVRCAVSLARRCKCNWT
jgi:hypothetical protein